MFQAVHAWEQAGWRAGIHPRRVLPGGVRHRGRAPARERTTASRWTRGRAARRRRAGDEPHLDGRAGERRPGHAAPREAGGGQRPLVQRAPPRRSAGRASSETGRGRRSFGREADLVAGAFDRAFWNDARRCCFDVILPDGPDARLRPNQLFAVGLPFPLLDRRRRSMVLEAVETALVTPVGLRTLAPRRPGLPAHLPRRSGASGTRRTTKGWSGPGLSGPTWTRCSPSVAIRPRRGTGRGGDLLAGGADGGRMPRAAPRVLRARAAVPSGGRARPGVERGRGARG